MLNDHFIVLQFCMMTYECWEKLEENSHGLIYVAAEIHIKHLLNLSLYFSFW
jgi:hypothetical protein